MNIFKLTFYISLTIILILILAYVGYSIYRLFKPNNTGGTYTIYNLFSLIFVLFISIIVIIILWSSIDVLLKNYKLPFNVRFPKLTRSKSHKRPKPLKSEDIITPKFRIRNVNTRENDPPIEYMRDNYIEILDDIDESYFSKPPDDQDDQDEQDDKCDDLLMLELINQQKNIFYYYYFYFYNSILVQECKFKQTPGNKAYTNNLITINKGIHNVLNDEILSQILDIKRKEISKIIPQIFYKKYEEVKEILSQIPNINQQEILYIVTIYKISYEIVSVLDSYDVNSNLTEKETKHIAKQINIISLYHCSLILECLAIQRKKGRQIDLKDLIKELGELKDWILPTIPV